MGSFDRKWLRKTDFMKTFLRGGAKNGYYQNGRDILIQRKKNLYSQFSIVDF